VRTEGGKIALGASVPQEHDAQLLAVEVLLVTVHQVHFLHSSSCRHHAWW
jgi:hypothetical protein